MKKYFKLARPDGWDFWTGSTINYRENIGGVVRPPRANRTGQLCSESLIHASDEPNKCFVGASIPCSAYIVAGEPMVCDNNKCGFVELAIVSEVTDLDRLFGWKYTEACTPIHPFEIPAQRLMTDKNQSLLRDWDSVWASVGDSVWASVWASVGDSVWASVGDSVWASVGDSVWASVGDSVWASAGASVGDSIWASAGASAGASVGDSVWASVWASVYSYIGSLFPGITNWEHIEHEPGVYPYQPVIDLWKQGIVPSFDGELWRLHSGRDAKIAWEGKLEQLGGQDG